MLPDERPDEGGVRVERTGHRDLDARRRAAGPRLEDETSIRGPVEEEVRDHHDPAGAEPRPSGDDLANARRRQADEGVRHVRKTMGLVDEPRELRHFRVARRIGAVAGRDHHHDLAGTPPSPGQRTRRIASAVAEHARDIVGGQRPAPVNAEKRPRAQGRRQGVRAARVGRTRPTKREGQENETGGAPVDDPAHHESERLTRSLEVAGLDVVTELAGQAPGQVMDRAGDGLPAPAEQQGRRDLRALGSGRAVEAACHAPAASTECLISRACVVTRTAMVAFACRSDKSVLTRSRSVLSAGTP